MASAMVLCALLLLALLCVAAARASETEDSERERSVSIESEDGTEVTFKSEHTATDGTEKELKIKMAVDSGVKLTVTGETETASTETESEFTLRLRRLFAYSNDDTASPLACHDVDLASVAWALACLPSPSTKGYVCTARSAAVNVTAHIVGEPVRRTNAPDLLPEGVEFDVSMAKPQCTAGAKLALAARFEGSVESEQEVDDDGSDDRTADGSADDNDEGKIALGGGAFRWLRSATIGGVDVPVTTVSSNGEEVTFLFDTTAVGNVVWDPYLGISAAPRDVGLAALAIAALAALIL